MTIAERITIYNRMNDAIDKAEADSYHETDDLEHLMHGAFRDHENHRQAGYDRGFQAEFQAEQDRLSAIYTNAADAYHEARRQAVVRVDAFFDWLSSAELVDAIPPGDLCTVLDPDFEAFHLEANQLFFARMADEERRYDEYMAEASAKGPRADITH